MEESVTYQAIIEKGQLREARALLLRLASHKFGESPPEVVGALESVKNREQLEEVALGVSSAQAKLLGRSAATARPTPPAKTSPLTPATP